MKRLVLGLALPAIVLMAAHVMAAGGGGMYSDFQEAWKRVQAQHQRFETEMSRVDREAARIVDGASILKKKRALTNKPRPNGQSRLCMKCTE